MVWYVDLVIRNLGEKKMFLLKSVTKVENLTVQTKIEQVAVIGTHTRDFYFASHWEKFEI